MSIKSNISAKYEQGSSENPKTPRRCFSWSLNGIKQVQKGPQVLFFMPGISLHYIYNVYTRELFELVLCKCLKKAKRMAFHVFIRLMHLKKFIGNMSSQILIIDTRINKANVLQWLYMSMCTTRRSTAQFVQYNENINVTIHLNPILSVPSSH